MLQASLMRQLINTKKEQINFSFLGQGEPVLFIHGGHSDNSETLFHKGFDTTKYCSITPSRPGYGQTPLTNENQSPEGTADLLISLLDRLNLKKVVVIGISAGGLTAIQLAANYPTPIKNWF